MGQIKVRVGNTGGWEWDMGTELDGNRIPGLKTLGWHVIAFHCWPARRFHGCPDRQLRYIRTRLSGTHRVEMRSLHRGKIFIDCRQTVDPVSSPDRRVSKGDIRSIDALGSFGHIDPRGPRLAIGADRQLPCRGICGLAVELDPAGI